MKNVSTLWIFLGIPVQQTTVRLKQKALCKVSRLGSFIHNQLCFGSPTSEVGSRNNTERPRDQAPFEVSDAMDVSLRVPVSERDEC